MYGCSMSKQSNAGPHDKEVNVYGCTVSNQSGETEPYPIKIARLVHPSHGPGARLTPRGVREAVRLTRHVGVDAREVGGLGAHAGAGDHLAGVHVYDPPPQRSHVAPFAHGVRMNARRPCRRARSCCPSRRRLCAPLAAAAAAAVLCPFGQKRQTHYVGVVHLTDVHDDPPRVLWVIEAVHYVVREARLPRVHPPPRPGIIPSTVSMGILPHFTDEIPPPCHATAPYQASRCTGHYEEEGNVYGYTTRRKR